MLQLSQVSLADCGEYACVASSELGTVITRASLTVLGRYPGDSDLDGDGDLGTGIACA